jgi:hypothetical protein
MIKLFQIVLLPILLLRIHLLHLTIHQIPMGLLHLPIPLIVIHLGHLMAHLLTHRSHHITDIIRIRHPIIPLLITLDAGTTRALPTAVTNNKDKTE